MNSSIQQYLRKLDRSVDGVRKLARPLIDELGMTAFAYVRVYNDGRTAWVTSDADHDRLVVESGFLEDDPLLAPARGMENGQHLWFHDREFDGCEDFYQERSTRFHVDHGLVMARKQRDYQETACFSGSLAKRPLYNVFASETGMLSAFVDHFKVSMGWALADVFHDGIPVEELKPRGSEGQVESPMTVPVRRRLVEACGGGGLLAVSNRERQCLGLLLEGKTYQQIGVSLGLSPRTVEHYFESVKDKLGLLTRSELHATARRMAHLGLL